ncbi:MAG: NTP transferase domain-containing protein [Thermoanaerobaculia bacterium]|nr:NTP transferase domain-containing protein [Thermoanaerobaculia bacterium]
MSQAVREAVVLCGGLGSRLRGQDAGRPKALVEVAGRPFLAWQLDWLQRLGVQRVVLAAGFRADQLKSWIHGTSLPVEVQIVAETRALGTAGALRNALEDVYGTDLFVTNGDTLLPDLKVDGVLAASSAARAIMTAVTAEDSHTGDCLELVGDRVTALTRRTTDGPAWKNGGFYRLPRGEVESWPAGRSSLERDVFPRLAGRGELMAHRTSPPLLDMGTADGRQAMDDFLLKNGIN